MSEEEDNIEKTEQQAKNHNKLIIALVLIVIIFAIGLTLGLYFGLRNKDNTVEVIEPDPEVVEPGPSEEHIYDDGVVILEPTCTEAGVKEYTCIICGETRYEGISSLGHSKSEIGYLIEDYSDSTGLVDFPCTRCHTSLMEVRDLYLSSDTWEEIEQVAVSGQAYTRYYIGETKDVSITETYNGSQYNEDITLRICDFNHDDLSEDDNHFNDIEYNYGTNKAAITFESITLLRNTYSFTSDADNTGGWEDSEIRTNLNDEDNTDSLYNTLIPSDLSPYLRAVDKTTNEGEGSSSLTTSSDKVFLLSLAELYSEDTILYTEEYKQVSDYGEIYSKEGSQYRYYSYFLGDSDPSTPNSELSKVAVTGEWDTTRNRWLTRTATLDNSQYIFYIESSGDLHYTFTNITRNVSVGFCI